MGGESAMRILNDYSSLRLIRRRRLNPAATRQEASVATKSCPIFEASTSHAIAHGHQCGRFIAKTAGREIPELEAPGAPGTGFERSGSQAKCRIGSNPALLGNRYIDVISVNNC